MAPEALNCENFFVCVWGVGPNMHFIRGTEVHITTDFRRKELDVFHKLSSFLGRHLFPRYLLGYIQLVHRISEDARCPSECTNLFCRLSHIGIV